MFVPAASVLRELTRLLHGFLGRFFQLLCLFSSDLSQSQEEGDIVKNTKMAEFSREQPS